MPPKKKGKGGASDKGAPLSDSKILASIRDVFGNIDQPDIPYSISTGITMLDVALNTDKPGLPCGRVTEIYSEENAGKTRLAMRICATVLREHPDAKVVFYDAEARISPATARKDNLFFDLERCFYVPAETMEQTFAHMFHLMDMYREENSKYPLVVVVDSLGMLGLKQEVEAIYKGEETMNTAGLRTAKLLNDYLKAAEWKWIRGRNFYVVLLNHAKVSIDFSGNRYAKPVPKSPGGKAMKFLATHRILLEKSQGEAKHRADEGASESEKDNLWGYFLNITVTKNTVDAADRRVRIPVNYRTGFMDRNSIRNWMFSDQGKKIFEFTANHRLILGDDKYTKSELLDAMKDPAFYKAIKAYAQEGYIRMCNGPSESEEM